jgi:hypothetical protein
VLSRLDVELAADRRAVRSYAGALERGEFPDLTLRLPRTGVRCIPTRARWNEVK